MDSLIPVGVNIVSSCEAWKIKNIYHISVLILGATNSIGNSALHDLTISTDCLSLRVYRVFVNWVL
jgi:hypothetical protein